MLVLKLFISIFFVLFLHNSAFAQTKQIAITIDDLPFVGEAHNFHLKLIMDTLVENQVPATGFIIAHEVQPNNWQMLTTFRDAGFGLGNHTYSHMNLSKVKSYDYMREIQKADKMLAPVLTKPKYFRYPYLAMGKGYKRNKILCYLAQKHYQVAPITIDSRDFAFNQRLLSVPEMQRRAYLQELRPFYLEFLWTQTKKAEELSAQSHNPDQIQILLIHSNLLNAYSLKELITMYKEHGYTFVSLKKALTTYREPLQCNKHFKSTPIDFIEDATIEEYFAKEAAEDNHA